MNISEEIKNAFDINKLKLHNESIIISNNPLKISTPKPCWAYACSFPWNREIFNKYISEVKYIGIKIDMKVEFGRVGVGLLNQNQSDFIQEKYISEEEDETTINFIFDNINDLSDLIVRNADPNNGKSQVIINKINVFKLANNYPPYLVDIHYRDYQKELRPKSGDSIVFYDEEAKALCESQIDHLEQLNLPVDNKRVLDVGCGVGLFTPYYTKRGCTIVGIDGRKENIEEMRNNYPNVEGIVADIQSDSLDHLGKFDIIHCYGLIYHLESPIRVMRHLSNMCKEFMIISTIICDSKMPIMQIADETKTVNQALDGIGCRPSPSFLVMALNRCGFKFVYGVKEVPNHPEFQFEWLNNFDWNRNSHNMRCILIASHHPISNRMLIPLLN